MSEKNNVKRLAKNTLMLYFRHILIMFVSLFTVRIILNVLGAEDYGIYNVVAGVVTMFSFLSGSMASASQRFFSYDLGKEDYEHLKKSFSMTVIVYFLLAFIIVLLAESIGLWFLEVKMTIPPERMIAARWVFHFAVIGFFFTIITTPYMACIIAHEEMNIYAIVSIIEVSLRLLVAFLLKIILLDKLKVYAVLLFIVVFINTTVYRSICRIKFEECKFKVYWEKSFFKQLTSYVGWNLFGSLAGVIRNQGINILLNLFFGPVVNAARGIAFQVNSAFISFAQNFSVALKPQIIKAYASNQKERMLGLVINGTRFIFYLMLIIAIPLFLETPLVMNLWLKNVPTHTVFFVRLVILDILVDSIHLPTNSVNQATGKIKLYQACVGGLLIMNLPFSYCLLRLGNEPEIVFFVSIILSFAALILRILIVQKQISYSLIKHYCKMFCKFILVTFFASILPSYLVRFFNQRFLQLCVFVLICVAWSLLVILIIDLKKEERKFLITKVKTFLKKKEQ